jgi:hypothetical protein
MERNCVKASDGRLLLAPKVIAAVIGIIGIALLAFPDPMRKLVDSFGRIKPLGSAAHLAIENQKGLTSEPLPLGISIADGSGGETVTVAGLAEGTELSLGTALGSGSWLVPVADLDKTFLLRSKATKADPWVIGLRRRRPPLVVAVALANKTARIAWAVMLREKEYPAQGYGRLVATALGLELAREQ